MEIKEKDLLKATELLNKVSITGVSNMMNFVTAYQLLTGMATVEEKEGRKDGTE